MNIMIDTNIVLDDVLNRTPNAECARKIISLAESGEVNAYITANSVTDIFYIVSKHKGEDIARKVIRNLLVTFGIVSVDGQDCLQALDLPLSDFEDAIVVVCAEKASLDCIVTNDKAMLKENRFGVAIINSVEFSDH